MDLGLGLQTDICIALFVSRALVMQYTLQAGKVQAPNEYLQHFKVGKIPGSCSQEIVWFAFLSVFQRTTHVHVPGALCICMDQEFLGYQGPSCTLPWHISWVRAVCNPVPVSVLAVGLGTKKPICRGTHRRGCLRRGKMGFLILVQEY